MNITEHIPTFLNYCKSQKRLDEKTIKAYKIDITQFAFFTDSLLVEELKKDTIRDYISLLNYQYKPKSVKRKLASIKGYISFLCDERILPDNPFLGMRISLPKSLSLPRTIPLQFINEMLVEAHKRVQAQNTEYSQLNAVRDTAVLELLFATGMRVSELCNIKESDLDLSEGVLFIHGKGNRERIIEIENAEVLVSLQQYAELKNTNTRYFFLNNRGNPISDQSARRIVHNYAKLVDQNRHITPHMFRHSFATLLLEEDVDLRYIQQLLGHSSIATTQIYTYVSSKKRRTILSTKHPRNKLNIM